MSARTVYQMKVEHLVDHTPDIRELVIKAVEPPDFRFRAGQFVMLHVPQDGPKPALRAYSIASDDRDNQGFRLIFKFVENGLASKYVWDLHGGETLKFTGPFGKVFFREPPTEQIVFMNTGSGVAQHLSYLLSKAQQYPDLKYRMLFGVRHQKDTYHQALIDRLSKELSDFQCEFVLSRPDESWSGKKGYVQDFLGEIDYLTTPTTFYLCGNGGMIKATKHTLESAGVDKARVWAEAFD